MLIDANRYTTGFTRLGINRMTIFEPINYQKFISRNLCTSGNWYNHRSTLNVIIITHWFCHNASKKEFRDRDLKLSWIFCISSELQ